MTQEREAVAIEALKSEIAKLPADFPNYADHGMYLPAGHWREILSALLQSGGEGWRLVPVEPTSDMIDAGRARWLEFHRAAPMTHAREVYFAMLAASPLPPAPDREGV